MIDDGRVDKGGRGAWGGAVYRYPRGGKKP